VWDFGKKPLSGYTSSSWKLQSSKSTWLPDAPYTGPLSRKSVPANATCPPLYAYSDPSHAVTSELLIASVATPGLLWI